MFRFKLLPCIAIPLLFHFLFTGCRPITVIDGKKSLKCNKYPFDRQKCRDLLRTAKASLGTARDRAVSDVKAFPVSSALTGASLCLSAAVWTGCLSLPDLRAGPRPKSPGQAVRSVLNLVLIPTFHPSVLLDLFSFYLTLRTLESKFGATEFLKLLGLDAFLGLVGSALSDGKFDFYRFSRSLTAASCLSDPEERVLFYGHFQTKRKYLLLYLLVVDYLLGSGLESVQNSLVAFAYGALSFLVHSFLS